VQKLLILLILWRHTFKFVVERHDGRWYAYCPALKQ